MDEISYLTKEEQAEKLADTFSSVSLEYYPLKTQDINVKAFNIEDIPVISCKVWKTLKKNYIKKNENAKKKRT